jgi:hypothetical protein
MNTSLSSRWLDWPRAISVRAGADSVHVTLRDGREITVPYSWFGFLGNASVEQRLDVRLIEDGEGIWWEAVDEGVSVPSLFGLPEYPPPDPRVTTYTFDYRFDGEAWDVALRGTDFATWGKSLATAKRHARELLSAYLEIDDLKAAGIEVVDEVQSPEAVVAK